MTGGGLLFIQSHLLDWYIQNKTVWVGESLNIWTADIFFIFALVRHILTSKLKRFRLDKVCDVRNF